METSIITLTTDKWTQLVLSGDAEFIVQNIGTQPILINFSINEPTIDSGHLIPQYGGLTQESFGTGDIWGKTIRGTSDVAVTK